LEKTNRNPGGKEVKRMSKKWLLVLGSGALVVVLLVGLAGGTLVFAQDTDPTPMGLGTHGRWDPLGGGGDCWTQFDAAAEALGLTPSELFTELHDEGKTLSEVSEEQGVDTEALQEAMNASRAQTMREQIQQAVDDGNLSQEQADWMLEGLDLGFMGGPHGMGPGGFGPPGAPFGQGQQ
jgi:lambda repressor-like predicted transcriptional regulator